MFRAQCRGVLYSPVMMHSKSARVSTKHMHAPLALHRHVTTQFSAYVTTNINKLLHTYTL
eukprot:m.166042 g.166042  ORF g.166042 m.166042 type:complete len:60 (-) comp14439_c1_seq3:39-218(-)